MNLFKNEYVTKCLIEHKFEQLSDNRAFGRVYQIPGYGNLDVNGFEHRFLFIHQGSGVYEHEHTKEIELYKRVSGDYYFPNGVCLLGQSHQIEPVKSTTIIETFKLDRCGYSNIISTDLLNILLKNNLEYTVQKLNRVITLLSNNIKFEKICILCGVSIDEVLDIYHTYFIGNFPIIEDKEGYCKIYK
ncbi:MAG: hypothetical protein IJR82_00180 [Bacilli bacterium]|nr:hypothetical protein [Bacilli bacterium]